MKLEYSAYTKAGKFFIRNKASFEREVAKFSDCELWVTIEKKKSKRSLLQNNYWWLCMDLLAKELGYTKDEMHQILKFKFLKGEKVNEKTGEVFEYLRSSTDLNKSEFSELVEHMVRWSAEHGIIIPEPNQQLEILG